MKVLMIIGSLSNNSTNLKLSYKVKEMLEEKGIEVSYLDYKYIPYMNTDIEFPTPEFIRRVRDEVSISSGVWIFTPEYNNSIPAPLKNLLDWLSRPTAKDAPRTSSTSNGVKVTVSSVSGGNGDALKEEMKKLLEKIHMNYMDNPQVFLSAYSLGNDLSFNQHDDLLNKQVDAFVKYIH